LHAHAHAPPLESAGASSPAGAARGSGDIVVTRGLTKRFGSLTALDGVDFHVPRGEICGLLGPNGAGKSTLIRLLLGYLRPTAGEAQIDGRNCYTDSIAVHSRTAYLPGDARLFAQMRGADVLKFFAGLRDAGYADRATSLADRLDLDLTRRTAAMSTGMRQKLALAAVLAVDAPLLILDEPTANLDPTVRGEVLTLVREARDAGRTVLFSSHVLDEVETACDRVVVLRRGRFVHVQDMHHLRRQHRIRMRWQGPPPEIPRTPAELAADPPEIRLEGEELVIVAPGRLAPLLGWLATLPCDELRIEPVGLAAVYDRFHPPESTRDDRPISLSG
jgi:ABC-2 type transport system ATP-binding protein